MSNSKKMTGFVRVAHWFEVDDKNQPIGKCKNANCQEDANNAVMNRNCVGGKIEFENGKPFKNKTVYKTSEGKTCIELNEEEKERYMAFLKQSQKPKPQPPLPFTQQQLGSRRGRGEDDEEEIDFSYGLKPQYD